MWDMLNSRAFKELSGTAAKALIYFLGKYRNGQNQRIELSYKEAETLGFPRPTFGRAVRILLTYGFLDGVRGGLRGYGKTMSVYQISDRWRDYGKPHFKEFDQMGWLAPDACEKENRLKV